MATQKQPSKKKAKKERKPVVHAIDKPRKSNAGRKTLYTPELADDICQRLAEGQSLSEICRADGMPAESTVRSWALDDKHPISASYTQAREIGYLKMADELLEIADDGSNDWMERTGKEGESLGWQANGEHVQRSRLRVDTRKWVLAKMLPKVFGDRVTTEVTGRDGGPIETKDTSDLEMARKIAFMLGKAVAATKASEEKQSDECQK